jgi:chromosome partitioning protein
MIITVTSYKGGVGKTTTAIHLAAYLSASAPTLLIDGDAVRSATKWGQRSDGNGLPFRIVNPVQMVAHVRNFAHIVIDTEGNPSDVTESRRCRRWRERSAWAHGARWCRQ